jgi:hypothetical protein
MQRPQQSHAHADLLLLLPLLSCKHRKAAFSGMAVTQPQPPLTTARLWNVLLGEAYWTWTFRASEYGLESSGDDYSGGAEFAEGPLESICSANSEWEGYAEYTIWRVKVIIPVIWNYQCEEWSCVTCELYILQHGKCELDACKGGSRGSSGGSCRL